MKCERCAVSIHHETEEHWSGWLDEDGDALSYVPSLHNHVPARTSDTGCWIDGHWGQYAGAAAIRIAADEGYGNVRAIDLAERHLATMGYSDRPGPVVRPLDHEECEALDWATDEATEWLSDHVAADGYSFGWENGELLLLSDDDWQSF